MREGLFFIIIFIMSLKLALTTIKETVDIEKTKLEIFVMNYNDFL